MRPRRTPLPLCLLAAAALAGPLSGQSSNLGYQLANLREDVRLLDERTRRLQAEVEELSRENARLRERVSATGEGLDERLGDLASVAQVNRMVQEAVEQLEKRDEALRAEIVDEFTEQMKAFAARVERALGNLPARGSTGAEAIEFHDNFPKTGTTYVVRSGDTLSSIAAKHGSAVDWIRHANKIADPSLLQVGQRLFIPQETD